MLITSHYVPREGRQIRRRSSYSVMESISALEKLIAGHNGEVDAESDLRKWVARTRVMQTELIHLPTTIFLILT